METHQPTVWDRDRLRFDAESHPIVVVDNHSKIVYFNDAWCELQEKRGSSVPKLAEFYRLVTEDRLLSSRELYFHATVQQGLQEVMDGRQVSFTRAYLCGTKEEPIPCQITIFRYLLNDNSIGAQLWHEHLTPDYEYDGSNTEP